MWTDIAYYSDITHHMYVNLVYYTDFVLHMHINIVYHTYILSSTCMSILYIIQMYCSPHAYQCLFFYTNILSSTCTTCPHKIGNQFDCSTLQRNKRSAKSFASHLNYPLTARVVWAPQMISQPVSSISPCSPLPSGTWRTPGLSVP